MNPLFPATAVSLFPHPTNSGAFATQIDFDGVPHVFDVGHDKLRAGELARALQIRARNRDPLDSCEIWLKEELARPVVPVSSRVATVAEIWASYGKAKLGLDPHTVAVNRSGFLRFVETVVLFEESIPRTKKHWTGLGETLTPHDYPAAAPISQSRLNADFVQCFSQILLKDIVAGSKEYEPRCGTIRSDIGKARAMFTPEAMVAHQKNGLIISNIRSLVNAETFLRSKQTFEPPDAQRFIDAFDDLRTLGAVDKEMHIIATLALECSGTPAEIADAETSDLGPAGSPTLKVRANTKLERRLLLSSPLNRLLRALPPGYILRGSPHARRDSCHRTSSWLRWHGSVGVFSPLDQFADFFGYFLASQVTPLLLHDRLGNRTSETTLKFLHCSPMDSASAALWPPELTQPLPQ